MAVVKVKKKEELDKLVAQVTLRLGKKVSQQDVIDACIEFSKMHIEELEKQLTKKAKMSKKRMKEILEMAEEIEYDENKTIDQELYGEEE